ncbi:uncharacterized protein MICPUCDRAFT_29754, partial [Micromonas pusilla CCMP1545]
MREEVDLIEEIDVNSVECLNSATGKDWGNCVKQGYREDARLLLTSDDDEQIIMSLPFKQLVNLTSLVVVGPDDDTRPKTVKLFVNKPNLSFDNCGKKPVATIALTDAQSRGGERVELEYTDFQNVRRVHVYAVLGVFVEDNVGGGDVTNVTKIVLQGHPVQTTNMSDLK